MHPAVLFVLIFFVFTSVTVLGLWLGNIRLQSGEHENPSLGTLVAAILGLLAFMLSFTFSAIWGRFAMRNNLIIEQAKALGVVYMRTSIIPERQKQKCRTLCHEYIEALMKIQSGGVTQKLLDKTADLNTQMWNEAASLVEEEMDSEMRSLFTSAVTDLFAIFIERKTISIYYRIPNAIWYSLLFLGGLGMFAFGYQAGLNALRDLFQLALLPLSFGLVIVLISELNSPSTTGSFRVTHKPLHEVMQLMKNDLSFGNG